MPLTPKHPHPQHLKTETTKQIIQHFVTENSLTILTEHRFCERRWRFDYYIPELNTAIEYEGIKGKSRHTSITGYTKDCEKYNRAAIQGITVLRYTVLNYREVAKDLKLLLNLQLTYGKEKNN